MGAVRMCKVFYCDARGDRFCCRDCDGYKACANRCLNDPSRCRLEDRPGERRAAVRKTESS